MRKIDADELIKTLQDCIYDQKLFECIKEIINDAPIVMETPPAMIRVSHNPSDLDTAGKIYEKIKRGLRLSMTHLVPAEDVSAKPNVPIFYICDKEKCDPCHDECEYTSEIIHAKNFKFWGKGFWENHTKEKPEEGLPEKNRKIEEERREK